MKGVLRVPVPTPSALTRRPGRAAPIRASTWWPVDTVPDRPTTAATPMSGPKST